MSSLSGSSVYATSPPGLDRSPTTTQRPATAWISWDAGESSRVLARQQHEDRAKVMSPDGKSTNQGAHEWKGDDTASDTSGGTSELMSKSSLASAEFWGMDPSSPTAGRFVWCLEHTMSSHRSGVAPAVRFLQHCGRQGTVQAKSAHPLTVVEAVPAEQEQTGKKDATEVQQEDMPEELRQLQGTWMDEKDPVVCYQVTGWWCQRFENRLRFGGAPRPQNEEQETEGVPGGKEAAFLLSLDAQTGRIVRGEKTDVMIQEASEDRVVWRARPGKHKVKRTRAGRKVFTWVRPMPPGLA